MDPNVDQHRAFGPQMAEFEVHIKGIRDRTIEYDGEQIVSKLDSFADVLVTHLHDVCLNFCLLLGQSNISPGNQDPR